MRRKWNYSSKWSMSYDDTVNFIREEFFKWYGVTPCKNIIRVFSVYCDRLYSFYIDDYNDIFIIDFMIEPNDGRHHHYILKYDVSVELTYCMELIRN